MCLIASVLVARSVLDALTISGRVLQDAAINWQRLEHVIVEWRASANQRGGVR